MSGLPAHVMDTTRETFERDVIVRSKELPVVVDFWAEWCQPCRLLAPLLERLAAEYDGQFVLVKANTEVVGEYAAALGVMSIPAVMGLRDGEVVDGFVGLQSETAVRAFLERLLPSQADRLVSEGRKLEETDPETAQQQYRSALELDPHLPAARIGLARVLADLGRGAEALEQLAPLERRGYLEPEAENIKARIQVAGAGGEGTDVATAREALQCEPDSRDRRLQLAQALAAAGQHEEALAIGLDLVETDRRGTGEEARKLMLAIFQLLPPDSGLANDYRRRLSQVL